MTPESLAWDALYRLHVHAGRLFSRDSEERRKIEDDSARLRAFIRNEPFWGLNDPPRNEDK